MGIEKLFEPVTLGSLALRNRVVMAPMTRCMSPGGVPGEAVARYYARRALGGVGLIVTEGTWVPHPSASNDPNVPRFYGKDALKGWRRVVEDVHAAGAKIVPQLWHVGQVNKKPVEGLYADGDSGSNRQIGPSGMTGAMGEAPTAFHEPASERDIAELIEAYGAAARSAQQLGFDGVEVHGAHGYLIDQFFWSVTNLRTDQWGGSTRARARFGAEIVREIRRQTSNDFPIIFRVSQWKLQNYDARLAETPAELNGYLAPLADAGVDIFHCSQRRFWEGEFDSDLNLAGWARKLTGLPSITVGSVTMSNDLIYSVMGNPTEAEGNLAELARRLDRGDFDLVAVGRALITDPDWARHVSTAGVAAKIPPYTPSALAELN
jgi:2,4-dienoyl-CoA reductase-like NADH-dependent reductase (Old Yellow Enzyme family)